MTTVIRLCLEGHRLWCIWDKAHVVPEDALYVDNAPAIQAANAAWIAYQDHRAACKECTKVEEEENEMS